MNIYKKLINNSLIFAVGNLGSKLIVIFLVPLYTYYLTTSEFGLVDLLTATISLLLPIFTLSVSDAVLRFVMDKNYDKQAVLINSLVVILIGFILLITVYPILIIIIPFDDYILYFYVLMLSQSIFITLTQFIRAKGMFKLFAVSGIVNALILLIFNILFLAIIKMGIFGYLLSLIVAFTLSNLFVCFAGQVKRDLDFKKVNTKLLKEMLKYSIPLMPNAIMWWVMGLSDRYIVTYFLGASANGLYAVANKIPSLLSMANGIFFQAWQMSAIEEAESKDKSIFFTNVFNVFSIFMLALTSFILVNLKILMGFFVSRDFYLSWQYVPFLLLGVVFSSFSGFLGTNYIAAKRTSGVFKTSILGAIVNIVLNIILIPIIGINGASIGTMLSFGVIWILRINDTKEFVSIKINVSKLLLTLSTIITQIFVLYINCDFDYFIQICLFTLMILINFNEFKLIAQKVKLVVGKGF